MISNKNRIALGYEMLSQKHILKQTSQPVRAWMPRPPFARSYTAILWRWAPIVAIYTLRTLVSLGLEQVKVTSEVHVDQGLAAHLLLLT